MSQHFAQPADLPWGPFYTVYRSGIPELTIHGLAYAWAEDRSLYANAGRTLLKIGNPQAPLWSRSLLKPFQLMALYPLLRQAYPTLESRHFALMLASHNGDAVQGQLLQEILALTGLCESDLQCPACRPLGQGQEQDEKSPPTQSALNHPCAGKHLAHLLYQKCLDLPLKDYLHPDQPAYAQLRLLLGFLLGREDFAESVDGCGMPNLALSAVEMAQLYHALLMPVSRDVLRQAPDELTDCLTLWEDIAALMRNHPALVGGLGRLDTALMVSAFEGGLPLIAKEGADGLLAVSIGPNARFQDGLGLLIKVASGYEPQQLRRIVLRLLEQLDLVSFCPPLASLRLAGEENPVLQTHFHFDLGQKAPSP
ncbi:asparaginase [Vampirovibrio chlorellavorus]|uniref:asparaginase n=1 Tax=Vampirovibrio chlorellavorus TaxID=758823 RepID=UPI0026ED0EF5|nr:asparaginase [Vampirovibrio chlorellavorus]